MHNSKPNKMGFEFFWELAYIPNTSKVNLGRISSDHISCND